MSDTFDFLHRSLILVGLLVLTVALTSLPTFAIAEPLLIPHKLIPHKAEYKIKISVLSGKLHTQVSTIEGGYSAHSVLRASGFARLFVRGDVTESSTFRILEESVRPIHYSSVDRISKEDKSMEFDFDWERQRVTGKVNGEDFLYELDGRVHDRVSIQYELMLDLLNGGTSDEYSLLEDDELKLLQISNIGLKEIKVPYGKFEAVGIQHRKKDSDRVTTLWCVEQLGYLPILIEQHRNGKLAVRAKLTRYEPTVADQTTT